MFHDDLRLTGDLHPDLALLYAAMEDGTREWLGEIGTPDVDAVCWQPAPGSYSIGALILHMCDTEAWWLQTVALGRPVSEDDLALWMSRETDQDDGVWATPPRQPFEWYLGLYQDVRRRSLSLVREVNDPVRQITRKGNSFSYRWIMAHLVQHDSYHGGQAVMLHELYKRLK